MILLSVYGSPIRSFIGQQYRGELSFIVISLEDRLLPISHDKVSVVLVGMKGKRGVAVLVIASIKSIR